MSVRVLISVGLFVFVCTQNVRWEGSRVENPSFHHCASMMYEVSRPSRSFALSTFIRLRHTHSLTNRPTHRWKVTQRNVGPSLWLLPFISCKISLSSWLCEIVAAYETFLSGPHEFFRRSIALLLKSWSLRWADGSNPKSSHILLTPEWGGFVCQFHLITGV